MWIDLIARFLQKLKIAFRSFWKQVLLAKILFIFRKEILFLGLKAKSGLLLKPLLNYEQRVDGDVLSRYGSFGWSWKNIRQKKNLPVEG